MTSRRPKTTLSRKVMDLEASLGVRLFERGSRSVHLTEDGEMLFRRTVGPFHAIREVADLLRDGRPEPQGRLRINVPALFALMLMGRLAARFKTACPKVVLEVHMEDREVDLVAEGFDLVIRANPRPDSDLVGSCFLREELLVVAAPTLPEQSPVPVVVRNAARHPANPGTAGLHDGPRCGVDGHRGDPASAPSGRRRHRGGPIDQLGSSGRPPAGIWALHASRRFASAKVRAFMEFLKGEFLAQ